MNKKFWLKLAGVGVLMLAGALAPCRAESAAVAVQTAASPEAAIEVLHLPKATLDRLAALDKAQWTKVLAVYVASEGESAPLPILGSYAIENEVLRFKPKYPLQRGVNYRVVFDPAADGVASGERIEKTFVLPSDVSSKPTELTNVYPSTSKLPENLLKFYLHFSAPMRTGDSYRYLSLVDDEGKKVELPFLELPQELWNEQGTRLTVLFDPGRVKQGLKPRIEEGAVLTPGRSYTLTVDPAWPDVHGRPLKEKFEKWFYVIPADVEQPAPDDWKLTTPVAGTNEPLVVQFPESLDHAMLERVFHVEDEQGRRIDGKIEIEGDETVWRFLPASAWPAGRYTLVVETTLEDVAGNSIGRPFEVDLNQQQPRASIPATATLQFDVKSNQQLTYQEKELRNWRQWRGPMANGHAPLANPPLKWSESENVRWKTSIPGAGSATPIVWDGKIFVATAVETDKVADPPPKPDPRSRTTPPDRFYRFELVCLSLDSGEILWTQTACEAVPHEGLHQTNTYAAASPVTDGERVYVSFGSRGVYCYDFAGRLLWKRDFGKMRTRSGWGEGVSPVVHQDKLIVNWDHEDDSAVYVLNAHTGETVWSAARDEPTSWATPLVVPEKERTQLILNATNRVRSYDLQTGEVIWECGGQTVNAIPSPVLFNDAVICMSGYRGHLACAIPLDSTGDITGTEKVRWAIHRNTPYVPSPMLYHNLLYFTRANANLLTCLEAATGQTIVAAERLAGLGNLYSSPAGAAGKIYITDRNGKTVVLKAGRRFEVLAVNEVAEPVDASPVFVGDHLLLRSHNSLYCFGP